jgi:tetratricopeptide (TPR) repeat protein
LSIDARIHSLEAEIAGSDPSLASPHHLAAKHDSLVDLYMRKGEITRQPEDFAAATRNNTAAVQAGQLALTPELLNGISSDEIGSCWCFQGARLAWRSRVLTKNGNRAGRATSDGIDSAATDQAIDAYDHALTQLPSQRSSLRREAAHNRANLLGARFDLTGSMNDIDEAIASGDVALAGAHSGMLPAVCNDVGILYQQRGRLNANIADLQRAIELGVRSIEDVDCPERIRVERILNLNVSRKLLYNLTRQVHQLEETRRELFQAAALCEQGRGQKTAHVLVRLATVAHLLAADTGIVGYHVEAVQFAHEGLENARTDDIVNEHAELIWVMATTLSETDAHGRSIEDLAKVLKKGESPL